MKEHRYKTQLEWSGGQGKATRSYSSYSRNHLITIEGKPDISASSDPAFRGDPSRINPEEMFLSSVSSCHMLWFLHLCTVKGIVVTHYSDEAEGIMEEESNGSGKFTMIKLYPKVKIESTATIEELEHCHHEAHEKCFIANSIKTEIKIESDYTFE